MNNNFKIYEKEFTYNELETMKQHAKQYDSFYDKKQFLKNVIPYEQKLILLESKRPYEVLKYLEELDMPRTKIVLNSLNIDEIRKIVSQFTLEDKEKFYETFSYLPLVNQFIKYDKKAEEHLEDVDINRKIDLLNSSTSKTEESANKIFDSISEEEKTEVISQVDIFNSSDISNSSMTSDENNDNIENQIDNEIILENKLEKANESELNEELEKSDKEPEIKENEEDKIKDEGNLQNKEDLMNNISLENKMNENLKIFQASIRGQEEKEIQQIEQLINNNNVLESESQKTM